LPHTIKHSIQKHIVEEVKFLEGGIVTLIESETRSTATEGKGENIVVAHVDFSKHQKDGSPPLLNIVEKEIFDNSTLYKQVFSKNGTEDYERNGNLYLLAHTNILFPHKYTVVTLVPHTEALSPIDPMKKLITATELEVSFSAMAITLATGVLVFFVVKSIANTISQPVNTMVKVANQIVSGAAEKDLVGNLGATHMKKLEKYAEIKGADGKDHSNRKVDNEMVMLTRSFLSMTQGLEKDANRKKKHIVHPPNPYYVTNEHELMNALQETDSSHWAGQHGGVAPIPQYAMAIATAIPYQGIAHPVAHLASPMAQPVPMPGHYVEGKNAVEGKNDKRYSYR